MFESIEPFGVEYAKTFGNPWCLQGFIGIKGSKVGLLADWIDEIPFP